MVVSMISTARLYFRVLLLLGFLSISGMIYYNMDWAKETARQIRTKGIKVPLTHGEINPHSGTKDMYWIGGGSMNLNDVQSNYENEAHKIKYAEHFLPHIKAVTEMKGITMAEARDACQWEDIDKVNFQYGADAEWAAKERSDEELDSRRREWQDFMRNWLIPLGPHEGSFSGRGIAVLSGNGKSISRLKVQLRALKRLKTKLGVEVCYWADEMDAAKKADIRSIFPEATFRDLSTEDNIIKTNHDNAFNLNYQLKPAAAMNSRFAQVLLLDSDNVPLIDPELLFESDTFKEYGSVFWPDVARTRPQNPMWAITNTKCRNNEFEQESGQLLIDKHRLFYHLQLTAWLNIVHATYYNEFLLGDKDLFRFAWHALQTEYGTPKKWVASVGTYSPDEKRPDQLPLYCGHTFAQHHPDDDRVAFFHMGLMKLMPREVMRWHRAEHGGVFMAYKRSALDEDFARAERVGMSYDGADYLPLSYQPKGGLKSKPAFCTDMWDVEPRSAEEIAPGFNQVFEDIGGYWPLGGGHEMDDPEHLLWGAGDLS